MQEACPAVGRILETSLYVADLERALAFYERVFGFEIMLQDERMIALAVPGRQVSLLFVHDGSIKPSATPFGMIPPHNASGQQHLCFSEPMQSWSAGLAIWPLAALSSKAALIGRKADQAYTFAIPMVIRWR